MHSCRVFITSGGTYTTPMDKKRVKNISGQTLTIRGGVVQPDEVIEVAGDFRTAGFEDVSANQVAPKKEKETKADTEKV